MKKIFIGLGIISLVILLVIWKDTSYKLFSKLFGNDTDDVNIISEINTDTTNSLENNQIIDDQIVDDPDQDAVFIPEEQKEEVLNIETIVKNFANDVLLMYGSDKITFDEYHVSKSCLDKLNIVQDDLNSRDNYTICLSDLYATQIDNDLQTLISNGVLIKKDNKYLYSDGEEYDISSSSLVFEDNGKYYVKVNDLDIDDGAIIFYRGQNIFIPLDEIPETYRLMRKSDRYNFEFQQLNVKSSEEYNVIFRQIHENSAIQVNVFVKDDMIEDFEIIGLK